MNATAVILGQVSALVAGGLAEGEVIRSRECERNAAEPDAVRAVRNECVRAFIHVVRAPHRCRAAD
jgi:hypothetical protein